MTPAVLRGERVVLRELEPGDAPSLRRIVTTPEVAAWWGRTEKEFPMGDDPDSKRFSVLLDERIVGMVQYAEEPEPDYRHASVDLFVDPAHHSRGLGSDALRTICRHLFEERRHHRITIDPAADNAAAVRCYEKAGFRPVGILHAAWRDPQSAWRDVLLMELVKPPADRRRPRHP